MVPDRKRLLAKIYDYAQLVVCEARKLGPDVPSASECEKALGWLERPVFICGHHRSGTTLPRSSIFSGCLSTRAASNGVTLT
jgi:hypothetical protein